MARHYNFSRTLKTPLGDETFSVDGFDSFDEARKAVEAGIRDRKLELEADKKKAYDALNKPQTTGTGGANLAPSQTGGGQPIVPPPVVGGLPASDPNISHSSKQPA